VLLVSSLWTVNSFTGEVVYRPALDNFRTILTERVYRTVALRSVGVAAAVTVVDAVLALPMAYYMAKVAARRWRHWLVIAVLAPLWASYLVKAYAWRVMLANGGPLDWLLGGPGRGPGYGLGATVIVLSYLWLPYMILPVYAGLDRLPDSLLEASADLGARGWRTFRSVVLPMIVPSVIAGSIFTFSLSLGDYITVQIVGGKTQLIGNLVYANIGAANNLPFAAALATVPVLVMVGYLVAVRRSGALEEL
jgi:putative spermidine/putrescine transport system permease protein